MRLIFMLITCVMQWNVTHDESILRQQQVQQWKSHHYSSRHQTTSRMQLENYTEQSRLSCNTHTHSLSRAVEFQVRANKFTNDSSHLEEDFYVNSWPSFKISHFFWVLIFGGVSFPQNFSFHWNVCLLIFYLFILSFKLWNHKLLVFLA